MKCLDALPKMHVSLRAEAGPSGDSRMGSSVRRTLEESELGFQEVEPLGSSYTADMWDLTTKFTFVRLLVTTPWETLKEQHLCRGCLRPRS